MTKDMAGAKAKLASPWVIFANQVESFFAGDPEVSCDYSDDGPALTVRVENATKADAIADLMGAEREFGNVTLKISVVPANADESQAALVRKALQGNPLFVDVEELPWPGGTATYAEMMPEVLTWEADSLQSPWGLQAATAEAVAREVFCVEPGTFFCTVPAEDE